MNFGIFGKENKQNFPHFIFKIIFGINSLKQTLNLNKSDDHVFIFIFYFNC
jgi:hypothetical protein